MVLFWVRDAFSEEENRAVLLETCVLFSCQNSSWEPQAGSHCFSHPHPTSYLTEVTLAPSPCHRTVLTWIRQPTAESSAQREAGVLVLTVVA